MAPGNLTANTWGENACRATNSEKRNTGNAGVAALSKNRTKHCTKTHAVQKIEKNVTPVTRGEGFGELPSPPIGAPKCVEILMKSMHSDEDHPRTD